MHPSWQKKYFTTIVAANSFLNKSQPDSYLVYGFGTSFLDSGWLRVTNWTTYYHSVSWNLSMIIISLNMVDYHPRNENVLSQSGRLSVIFVNSWATGKSSKKSVFSGLFFALLSHFFFPPYFWVYCSSEQQLIILECIACLSNGHFIILLLPVDCQGLQKEP